MILINNGGLQSRLSGLAGLQCSLSYEGFFFRTKNGSKPAQKKQLMRGFSEYT